MPSPQRVKVNLPAFEVWISAFSRFVEHVQLAAVVQVGRLVDGRLLLRPDDPFPEALPLQLVVFGHVFDAEVSLELVHVRSPEGAVVAGDALRRVRRRRKAESRKQDYSGSL